MANSNRSSRRRIDNEVKIAWLSPVAIREHGTSFFYLEIVTHGANSAVALTEVLASRTPVRLLHMYQPLGLGLWYAAFSFVYYAAGGTDS